MIIINKLVIKVVVCALMFTLLSGCSSMYAKQALKHNNTELIDKYIRYIDNYLTNEHEFVFNNASELNVETLYEFIHFMDAKEKLNIIKYDDGKYYLTQHGAKWLLERYFKTYRFNEKDMISYDHAQKVFIGPKRKYDFIKKELECIYLSNKQVTGGNLILVADYYDPFDINKLNKLYSKTYTIKLTKEAYKYISVTKTLNENLQQSIKQKDESFYINYYIKPFVNAGLAKYSWNKAEQIDANDLLAYASIPFLNANINYDDYLKEDNFLHIPAELIEKQLNKKFDLPENFLKLTNAYNALENCFVGNFTIDTSYNPVIELRDFTLAGENMQIVFTVKETSDNNSKNVTLNIVEQGKGFKYISCEVK